jgi:hypothetical protein
MVRLNKERGAMKKFGVLFFLLISLSTQLLAQSVALVKSVNGEVIVIHESKNTNKLKVGDKIFVKDIINTSTNSTIGLIFEDNTLISIGSNSKFSVDEYLFEPAEKKVKFGSNLLKGTMACITGLIPKINPEAMTIKTKSASIGIRGTYFVVEAEE